MYAPFSNRTEVGNVILPDAYQGRADLAPGERVLAYEDDGSCEVVLRRDTTGYIGNDWVGDLDMLTWRDLTADQFEELRAQELTKNAEAI
jgi:hypothetical protein